MPEVQQQSAKKVEPKRIKHPVEEAPVNTLEGTQNAPETVSPLARIPGRGLPQQNMLRLQRSVGNTVVVRDLIQRDPNDTAAPAPQANQQAVPQGDAQAAPAVWQVPAVFGGATITNGGDASAALIDIKRQLEPLKDQFEGIPLVFNSIEQLLPETYGNAGSGPLKADLAGKLSGVGLAANGAYNVALNQMKAKLQSALSNMKADDKANAMLEDGADMLHATAFGKGEDSEALEHAKEGFEKLHIFVEWAHYTNEWATKALTTAQSAEKFEKIAEAMETAGEWGGKASIAIAALNSALAIYSAIKVSKDPGASDMQKGIAQTQAGLSMVPLITAGAVTVGTLTAAATGIGLLWTTLVPQIEQAMHMLEQLDEMVAAYYKATSAEEWWDEARKEAGGSAPQIRADQLSHFPGGQETLNFMWAIFQGNPPEEAPALVTKFFYDTKAKMNEGHEGGEGDNDEMETEWHLFRANEVTNLIPWVQRHKEEVWGMLYGSLPHP